MTVFVPELAISIANNSGLDIVGALTSSGEPYDLTGATISAQARAPGIGGGLLCDIGVTILYPPTSGLIQLLIDEDVLSDLGPQEGVYDVVITPPGGQPWTPWQAPFNILQGATLP